jgi:hypothetical protein
MNSHELTSLRFKEVRTVLIVLSSKSMEFDSESLRYQVRLAYPEAAVFFTTVSGLSLGVEAPSRVDLTIDFTQPGARQSLLFASSVRGRSRYCVGRQAGWFYRKWRYDRILNEKNAPGLAQEYHTREREVQRRVLQLCGVFVEHQGQLGDDLGKTIARTLPPLARV